MFKSNTSRTAGWLYLITVLAGLFSLMYVPKQLFVYQDMAQTLQNLQTQDTLFRWGIVMELLCYVTFLLLPIALYQHFESTHKTLTNAMLALVLVAVPLSMLAVGSKLEMLSFINASELERSTQELQLKTAFLDYRTTMALAQIFWGLWLIPFGYLGWASKKLPKFLALCLILGGIGYQCNVFGGILIDDYKSMGIFKWAKLPASIGELGTCLWLLIFGMQREA